MNKNLHQQFALALYVVPVAGIFLAGINIWHPYSYWLDELYSVTASALSFKEMFRAMLSDVHPPLYQVMLWIWMRLLSDYEPIVRGFSLICSISAATYIFLWGKRLDAWSRALMLTFFATSWLFVYYSQEARSYSLLLLFSTIQIGLFISDSGSRKDFAKVLLCAILLAWTHYFGLILAGSVLCWLFFQNLKNHSRLLVVCAVGIAALAWPFAEFVWGSLGQTTGGKFWIQVDGPLGTLAIFFKAIVPVLKNWGVMSTAFLTVTYATFAIALICWRLRQASRAENLFEKKLILKLSYCLLWVLIAVMVIDLHTPISTERNYIVLLPVVSILFGIGIGTLATFRYAASGVLLVALVWGKMQLDYSHNLLLAKWAPFQNWRDCAEYIVKNVSKGQGYYLRLSDAEDVDRVFNYYVKRFSHGEISLQRVYASMLGSMTTPAMVFVGGVSVNTIEQVSTKEKITPKEIMYPTQSWTNSTAVLFF